MWVEMGSKYLILENYIGPIDVPWNENANELHFVVILTDRIGDAFNAIYFLSNLKQLYPQAKITYIGRILGDAEFHKQIIGQYVDQVLFKEMIYEVDFKRLNPDVIFDLNPISDLFSYYPSELAVRIGHNNRCDIHVPQPRYNMKANDHLNILRLFGKEVEFKYKPISLPPMEDDRVLPFTPKSPYIALCLEATAKAWMMSDCTAAALIEYLLELDKWDVYILGSNINENGYAYCGKSSRVHQCTGVLSLYQTICMLEGAELVISVDTGLMHAASYLGKPLLGIFTCGEPHKNGPQGQTGATMLINVHSEAPEILEKIDRLQPFTEQAYLRIDHVIKGFDMLLKAKSSNVTERLLNISNIPWESKKQNHLITA